MCKFHVREFGADGKLITSSHIHGPEELDWMPMEVKVYWFLYMGRGNSATKSVLLESQGELHLLTNLTLSNDLDHKEYREKYDGSRHEIEEFIQREGISRQPRNQ